MNRFQTFSLAMEGKVNIELLAAYKDKIETLSDETLFRFCYLELKNPIIGLILGVAPAFILSGLLLIVFIKGIWGLVLQKWQCGLLFL
ncbi:hypothetical protein NKG38_001160 [Campylobacter coli]|nr:hypothetical protein [Campylobacter coli]